MQKLLNDDVKDLELYSKHKAKYLEVRKNRRIRRNTAYENYVNNAYPILPKGTLADLQRIKQNLISANEINFSNQKLEKILEIQTKIDNQDYSVEGTLEWTSRQEYLVHTANFVWPDANELVIRQQEEAELLVLLN